jgi:hypothetical protein
LSDERSQQELYIALQVNPIIHDLLSLPRPVVDIDLGEAASGTILQEVLRVSALIFAGLLRQHCNVGVTGLAENQHRLGSLLSETSMGWLPNLKLQLWVLTMSALAVPVDRTDIVARIAVTMDLLGLYEWPAALDMLKDFIWISAILDRMARDLGGEVEAFLLSSSVIC